MKVKYRFKDNRRVFCTMNSLIGKFVFAACLAGCAGAASAEATLAPVVPQASRSGPSEVLLWDQMDAQQRARLWPLLTHEQRLFQWRYMTKDERREMRMNMTPGERRAIKQRYVIDFTPNQERTVKSVRRMTPAERELLRQQVIEVHVEIRRGVPYNCTDPTDCPRSAFRTRAAEAAGSMIVDEQKVHQDLTGRQ